MARPKEMSRNNGWSRRYDPESRALIGNQWPTKWHHRVVLGPKWEGVRPGGVVRPEHHLLGFPFGEPRRRVLRAGLRLHGLARAALQQSRPMAYRHRRH